MVTVILPVTRREHVVAWAFVDSSTLDRIGRVSLRLGSHGYAIVAGPARELLHRLVLGLAPGDGRVVDHISGNKMDCTRRNLRIGTQALNLQNVSRSQFCGTYPNHRRWGARAKKDGKTVYLGTYDTREQAAEVARDFRRKHYPYATTP